MDVDLPQTDHSYHLVVKVLLCVVLESQESGVKSRAWPGLDESLRLTARWFASAHRARARRTFQGACRISAYRISSGREVEPIVAGAWHADSRQQTCGMVLK